jgi:hypothetical protein
MRTPETDHNPPNLDGDKTMLRTSRLDDLPLSIIVSSLIIGIIFATATLYLNGLSSMMVR